MLLVLLSNDYSRIFKVQEGHLYGTWVCQVDPLEKGMSIGDTIIFVSSLILILHVSRTNETRN